MIDNIGIKKGFPFLDGRRALCVLPLVFYYKRKVVRQLAVSLLNKNNHTNVCIFSFDNWASDSDSLPNLKDRGKGVLAPLVCCAQGSVAKGTSGDIYVLSGNNTWIKQTVISGGTGTGGGSGTPADTGGIEFVDGETGETIPDAELWLEQV